MSLEPYTKHALRTQDAIEENLSHNRPVIIAGHRVSECILWDEMSGGVLECRCDDGSCYEFRYNARWYFDAPNDGLFWDTDSDALWMIKEAL